MPRRSPALRDRQVGDDQDVGRVRHGVQPHVPHAPEHLHLEHVPDLPARKRAEHRPRIDPVILHQLVAGRAWDADQHNALVARRIVTEAEPVLRQRTGRVVSGHLRGEPARHRAIRPLSADPRDREPCRAATLTGVLEAIREHPPAPHERPCVPAVRGVAGEAGQRYARKVVQNAAGRRERRPLRRVGVSRIPRSVRGPHPVEVGRGSGEPGVKIGCHVRPDRPYLGERVHIRPPLDLEPRLVVRVVSPVQGKRGECSARDDEVQRCSRHADHGKRRRVGDVGVLRIAARIRRPHAVIVGRRGDQPAVKVGDDVRPDRGDGDDDALKVVRAPLDLEPGLVRGVIRPVERDRVRRHVRESQKRRRIGRGSRHVDTHHPEGVHLQDPVRQPPKPHRRGRAKIEIILRIVAADPQRVQSLVPLTTALEPAPLARVGGRRARVIARRVRCAKGGKRGPLARFLDESPQENACSHSDYWKL